MWIRVGNARCAPLLAWFARSALDDVARRPEADVTDAEQNGTWQPAPGSHVTICGRVPVGYPHPKSLLDRISIDPEIVHGRPAVRGTRLRVTDVLSLLAAGATEDEILEDYPYLVVDDIRACLAYAAIQADHPVVDASGGA